MCIDEKAFQLLVDSIKERNKSDKDAHADLWNAIASLNKKVGRIDVQLNNGISEAVKTLPEMHKQLNKLVAREEAKKDIDKSFDWLKVIAGGIVIALVSAILGVILS